jgi:hypothetical protein
MDGAVRGLVSIIIHEPNEGFLPQLPDDHWGLNNLGFFYDAEGHVRESLRLRVRKVDLRPENQDIAFGDLWSRLMSFGEMTAADRIAARCDRQPDFGHCRDLLLQRDALPVWRELRQGHPEEALRIAEHLVRKFSRLDPATVEELNTSFERRVHGSGDAAS